MRSSSSALRNLFLVKKRLRCSLSNHHPLTSLAQTPSSYSYQWDDHLLLVLQHRHHLQQHRTFHSTSLFQRGDFRDKTSRRVNRGRSSPSLRRHHWSIPEMKEETQRLLSLIPSKPQEGNIAGNSTRDSDREAISINHCYNILEAWMEVAKNGYGIRAARQAHSVLQALEDNLLDRQHGGGGLVPPKTSFYNVVLQSYALCGGGVEAAQAAQHLLEHMMKQVARHDRFPRPTTKTFNIVFNAWAKSRCRNAGLEAEALLKRMQEWSLARSRQHPDAQSKGHQPAVNSEELCRVDARTVGSIMDAWAKSGNPDAPERVERLLQWALEQESSSGDPKCVDLVVFHTVMNAWVRSGRGREAARRVEITFEHLQQRSPELKANTRTYSLIVDGWARCEEVERTGYSSKRASFILREMIKLYKEGSDVKPNTWVFSSCMAAWSRCIQVPEAATEAEALLDALIGLYKETDEPSFYPDATVWNAVIAAWVRASDDPQAIEHGRRILNKMKDFAEPDLISYNTLLGGMAKRGLGKEASHLLEWLGRNSKLEPDIYSFNSVLNALAKDGRDGSAVAAEKLLRRMEGSNVRPDKISYTSVIDSWARSGDADKAFRVAALVDAMIQKNLTGGGDSLKPDVYVFTSLLKACLTMKERSDRVLNIAKKTMQRLESGGYGRPNHASYNAYMTAVNNLCASAMERKSLLESAFASCATEGYVSEEIMKFSPQDKEHPREVLLQWSRNVPLQDRPLAAA